MLPTRNFSIHRTEHRIQCASTTYQVLSPVELLHDFVFKAKHLFHDSRPVGFHL